MTSRLKEILMILPQWSKKEVQENFQEMLTVFLSCLEVEDEKASSLQALQALLRTCLPCVASNEAETKILKYALPAVRNLFHETLGCIQLSIEKMQSDEVIDFSTSLLQVCIELLDCLDVTLSYIASLGKVSVTDFPSVPKVIVNVLYDAFKHFKDSTELYGDYFQPLGEVLTAMFRKSSKVQQSFFVLMTENLQFDCGFEEDVSILTESVETLGRIGELVIGLDVKTMAELWKGYTQLTQQYAEHLKPRLDVATPIKFLSYDICCSLKLVSEMGHNETEIKIVARTLKIGGFTLKLIIKLCESYAGCLGECHKELLTLLISLHFYSLPYLQTKETPRSIAEDVERHLTIGAEPLLTALIPETQFIQHYFDVDVKKMERENHLLGFLLLSTVILKKLLRCEPAVRQLYHNDSRNVFDFVFKSLENCHSEMCWRLNMPAAAACGEPSRAVDLYESLLTHAAAFAVTTPPDQFPAVEQVLLDSVLQANIWRAMLATDVWCIVARYGSTELCLEQLRVLIDVFRRVPSHVSYPENTHLDVLLARLFLMLSEKSKSKVLTSFPPTENIRLWETLRVKHLPDKLQPAVIESFIALANNRITDFLGSKASVKDYSLMFESLSGIISIADIALDGHDHSLASLTGNILTLWQRATIPRLLCPEETSQKGCQWLHDLLHKLCTISSSLVMVMNGAQLLQVLQSLKTIIRHSSSSLKVSATLVLEGLATRLIDLRDQQQVFPQISHLFTTLLQDKNPIVSQTSLKTFAYFARVTKHEQIVSLTVCHSKTLRYLVTSYLQKMKVEQENEQGIMSYKEYLESQSMTKFYHKCAERNPLHSIENGSVVLIDERRTCKNRITNPSDSTDSIERLASVIDIVERMRKDANLLATLCENSSLGYTVKDDIRALEMQLSSIVN